MVNALQSSSENTEWRRIVDENQAEEQQRQADARAAAEKRQKEIDGASPIQVAPYGRSLTARHLISLIRSPSMYSDALAF